MLRARLHRDGGTRAIAVEHHRHRHRDHARHMLFVVRPHPTLARLAQLVAQIFQIGDGVLRARTQRQVRDQLLATRPRQERQQQLAARRAMQRHARAGRQFELARPVRLHTIEIDEVVAREHRQVAGLAELVDQLLEDAVTRSRRADVHQCIDGHGPHSRRRLVMPAAGLARDKPCGFELFENPMHRLLRQTDRGDDLRECHRGA